MSLATTTPTVTGKLKFGFGQLFKPTPETAKLVFRFVLYASSVIVAVLTIFGDKIDIQTKQLISWWALNIVTFVHFLSKLFGVEVQDPQTYNSNEVSSR